VLVGFQREVHSIKVSWKVSFQMMSFFVALCLAGRLDMVLFDLLRYLSHPEQSIKVRINRVHKSRLSTRNNLECNLGIMY